MIRIIKNLLPPSNTNNLWIDLSDESKIKMFRPGKGWTSISISEYELDKLNKRLDLILNNEATDVIDSIRELESFLSGITNEDTLTGLLTIIRKEFRNELKNKVDKSEGKSLIENTLIQKLQELPDNGELTKKLDNLDNLDTINDIVDTIDALSLTVLDKVSKVEGKDLSSNDFTDEYKTKLDRYELVLETDDEIEEGMAQIASSEDYRSKLKEKGYVIYHDIKYKVKDCGVTSNSIPWIVTEGLVITNNEEGELFDHTQGNFLRSVAIWFDGYLVYQPYDTTVNSEAIYIDEISIDDIDDALNSNAIKSLELTDEKANSLTLKLKKATSQGVSVYLKRETEWGDDKLQLTNIRSTSVNGNTAFLAGVMMTNTLNDDNATYSKICHILIADNAVLIYPEFVPSRAELNNKVDKEEGKVLSSNDYTDIDKAKVANTYTKTETNTAINNLGVRLSDTWDSQLNDAYNHLNDNKVGKVDGKQLSTEDFTTALKLKLDGLTNYDDEELQAALQDLKDRLDTILDEENATAVIDTFQEIENFLRGVTNTETLTGLLLELKDEITSLCANTYVTLTTEQNITGKKMFGSGRLTVRNVDEFGLVFYSYPDSDTERVAAIETVDNNGVWHANALDFYKDGRIAARNGITAPTFIKSGGTSSQFLKADGSVDSTAYYNDNYFKCSTDVGGSSKAIQFKDAYNTIVAHCGTLFQDGAFNRFFIGWGANSYLRENSLSISSEEFLYKNNKIWHSDNDGSGSGLDADLLDGVHNGELTAKYLNNNGNITNANSIDKIGLYNVTQGTENAPFEYGTILHLANGNGPANVNGSWIYQLAFKTGGNIFIRSITNVGSWTSWIQLASLNSNVASADKLTTKQLTNEDLNTIKDVNFSSYYATGNHTCTNVPNAGNGFYLQVFGLAANYLCQILTEGTSGITYKRKCANGTWSNWKKILTEDDVTKVVEITESEYNALTTRDSNTLYCIPEE